MPATTQALREAIAQNTSQDAFAPLLTPLQWDLFETYLQPVDLSSGQILIDQGATDRTLFFLESGVLTVHRKRSQGQHQLAILSAGSVVGEGAFFSRLKRTATVVATGPARVWRLAPVRLAELSNRQPQVAYELAMALGAVMARRMVDRPKRVAVT